MTNNQSFEKLSGKDGSAGVEDPNYPASLKAKEVKMLSEANTTFELQRAEVGLAFSGGGIRSATFCLGILQGLAGASVKARGDIDKSAWLSRFGFLSTVSGGGYIGAFLTQLMQRTVVTNPLTPDDVERALLGKKVQDENVKPGHRTFGQSMLHWLRENGRYLAPSGSGDMQLAVAVVLRNWLSLQVVLCAGLLLTFLLLDLLRWSVFWVTGWLDTASVWQSLLAADIGSALSVLHSPFFAVALALIAFGAMPLCAAYWAVPSSTSDAFNDPDKPTPKRSGPLLWRGMPLVIIPGVFFALLAQYLVRLENYDLALPLLGDLAGIGLLFGLICMVIAEQTTIRITAFLILVAANAVAWPRTIGRLHDLNVNNQYWLFSLCVVGIGVSLLLTLAMQHVVSRDAALNLSRWPSYPRHVLSRALAKLLLPIALAIAIALLDQLAVLTYKHLYQGNLGKSLLALLSATLLVASNASKIADFFTRIAPNDKRAAPITFIIAIVTISLIFLWLLANATIAQALIWNFKEVPPYSVIAQQEIFSHLQLAASVALALAILAALQPLYRGFINASGLQSLYEQRLKRAYLGASNTARHTGTKTVTESLAEDETSTKDSLKEAVKNGAPIHIVNLCINETVHTEMGVQQQDRKGLNLAASISGLSVGSRHHLLTDWVFPTNATHSADQANMAVQMGSRLSRRQSDAPYLPGFGVYLGTSDKSFRPLLPQPRNQQFLYVPFIDAARSAKIVASLGNSNGLSEGVLCLDCSETMPLSKWVSISGAAFSTGTGFRTSRSMAALCGLFNVRTGYWWDSGCDGYGGQEETPEKKPFTAMQSSVFSRLFPIYTLLASEFRATYYGTAARRWYLSDGGHFENLGVYELIRRRLKLIVGVDAGCDPNNEFEDLANLIRKARIDFGAEIRFLEKNELDALNLKMAIDVLGTLGDLRRESGRENHGVLDVDAKTAGKHAAVALIDYGPKQALNDRYGLYLYIKPTVIAEGLPTDLAEYLQRHPDFPHQTTGDQFFDEAQWESYRKLGELIGTALFAKKKGEDDLLLQLAKSRTAERLGVACHLVFSDDGQS
jgi:hypothetical protein